MWRYVGNKVHGILGYIPEFIARNYEKSRTLSAHGSLFKLHKVATSPETYAITGKKKVFCDVRQKIGKY
jgi:hypothetical protein